MSDETACTSESPDYPGLACNLVAHPGADHYALGMSWPNITREGSWQGDTSKTAYHAPTGDLTAACEDLAAELAIGQARTDGEAIPPVTLTFPGFPSIRGAGPAITEIPPVRPDWIYGPGGVRERVAERMAAEAEADAEGAE